MAEAQEAFVAMLLAAAGGNVADSRDRELAQLAARWAIGHGWRRFLGDGHGFVCSRAGLEFWVDDVATRDALMFMARIHPGAGWRVHGRYPIAHLGHALDVLATEGLLPARFAPLGRRALENYAEALDRAGSQLGWLADSAAAEEIAEYGELYPWEMRIRAAVMHRAADQARAFPRSELAVT